MEIVAVSEIRSHLGEGPVYDEDSNSIIWTDIEGKSWHRFKIDRKETSSFKVSGMIGAIVKTRTGGLYAAIEEGFGSLSEESGYKVSVRTLEGFERMNDAKCDAQGRFWAGSTDRSFHKGGGKLHRLDANSSHKVVLEGLTLPNGMDWSPDNSKFYLVDSIERVIWRFDFNLELGLLSNQTLFYDFKNEFGIPDGMCVCQQGNLYVAMWDGGQLIVISSSGKKLESIKLPTKRPTSCVFGGEHYDQLFITSATVAMEISDSSVDGRLFRISELSAKGKASNFFNG